MSIQIVSCKNCRSSAQAPNAVTMRVQMVKSSHCDACRHDNEDQHSLYFCSPACMLLWLRNHEQEFLKDVARFRAGRIWFLGDDPPPDPGVNEPAQIPDPVMAENVFRESRLKRPELTKEVKKKILEDHLCCITHCCARHGCKYGLPDCPVVLGLCHSNECEFCVTHLNRMPEEAKRTILEKHKCCPSHCCGRCRTCKYSYLDCPVVLGLSLGVECEYCEREDYDQQVSS